MDANKTLRDAAARQGWTEHTMLSVVTDFINEYDMQYSFVDYIQYRIEEE